jgi:DNA-binding transcriptional LysR family regulator
MLVTMDTRSTYALWAHLHALGVLAECGSYTAAAQRLAISKAAMSQRISELERAAGLPLVRRTTRSVRLTEAGQQLVDATRDAYQQIERSFVGVKDLAGAPRGLLRVTAPVALGRQQVVPRLAAFLRQYADIRIELELSDRLVPLAQEGFDLAIRHTATPPDTHVAWALCETRSVLVATRAYLRRRGTPRHPSDLADHECLHYLRPGESPVWRFEPERISRERPEAVSVAIRGCFGANNSEVLREAVLDGLGLAILPDFSAQAALKADRVVRVLPGWRPVGLFGGHIYALRPYAPQVPRAVQAFVEYLRVALRDGFSA